ncbi:NmrA family NAD(P)-binding protein [Streptomyces calidiresistens]|uniref:NAD(P)H-binding protein n=1 Tax=Streptomyces calidiresistens TaxID=1485586 RepID=A0A7W3T4S3_9ACTN|nr:NAD(P)H-binding protein [Streptomyces calidiresistens]MBB0230912.1 NAD(P)H-binding protein [Streptomyces calidiresistens]
MTSRTERSPVPSTSSTRSTSSSPSSPTLVIGGTGKTGRRVAERLTARGLPVRIGSRSGEPPFDWGKPASWEAAVEGTGAVYITYHPDLGFPGAAEAVGAFSRLAVAAGTRRLVLLSGRGEEGALRAEREVRESGAEWTVVRAGWFFQNFDEGFFLESVLAGELALPTAEAVEPFVDADDIADVVVEVLTSEGHVGRIHELSGPRALGFREVAAELSRATGRDIRYLPVPLETYRETLRENGFPVEFADLFRLISDGRNAHPVAGVREVLGRPPRDFARYARETAATGVWDPR